MGLLDLAFPYRADRSFGAASFALVFVALILEVELLVLIALGVVAHRIDLFMPLQTAVFPAAAAVSLAASGVFAWRARAWTRARIAGVAAFGGSTDDYAAKLRARARAVGAGPDRT